MFRHLLQRVLCEKVWWCFLQRGKRLHLGAGGQNIFKQNLKTFSKIFLQELAPARYQIQGCFKTEWSDGGAGNGARERFVGDFLLSIESFFIRERSVGDLGEVRGDACLRCAGFQPSSYKFLFIAFWWCL